MELTIDSFSKTGKETAINSICDIHKLSVSTEERSQITKLRKYCELYPDEASIRNHSNTDDMITVHFPAKWLQIKAPRAISEETRAKRAEHMMKVRTSHGARSTIQSHSLSETDGMYSGAPSTLKESSYARMCTIRADESKWIDTVLRSRQQYPDQVVIIQYPEMNDGLLEAQMPFGWIHIKPPRKAKEEERLLRAEILKRAREKKGVPKG